MRFILVLHGVTDWNDPEEGRLQGQTGDVPLNMKGRRQARELAATLKSLGITRIISSDLLRAFQTAEIIREELQRPVRTDARLRECSFGRLEGILKKERDKIDKQYGLWRSFTDYDYSFFGGENRDQVLARHLQFFEEMSQKNQASDILLVVGHHCGMNTLLAHLGHEPTLQRFEHREITYP